MWNESNMEKVIYCSTRSLICVRWCTHQFNMTESPLIMSSVHGLPNNILLCVLLLQDNILKSFHRAPNKYIILKNIFDSSLKRQQTSKTSFKSRERSRLHRSIITNIRQRSYIPVKSSRSWSNQSSRPPVIFPSAPEKDPFLLLTPLCSCSKASIPGSDSRIPADHHQSACRLCK